MRSQILDNIFISDLLNALSKEIVAIIERQKTRRHNARVRPRVTHRATKLIAPAYARIRISTRALSRRRCQDYSSAYVCTECIKTPSRYFLSAFKTWNSIHKNCPLCWNKFYMQLKDYSVLFIWIFEISIPIFIFEIKCIYFFQISTYLW